MIGLTTEEKIELTALIDKITERQLTENDIQPICSNDIRDPEIRHMKIMVLCEIKSYLEDKEKLIFLHKDLTEQKSEERDENT